MQEGWKIVYIDGSGAQGRAASAAYSEDHRRPTRIEGSYLGTLALVAVAEGQALTLELQDPADMPSYLLPLKRPYTAS